MAHWPVASCRKDRNGVYPHGVRQRGTVQQANCEPSLRLALACHVVPQKDLIWSVNVLTVTLGRTVERREVESSVCVCAHSSGVGSLVSSICLVVISTIKGQTEEQVVP